MTEGVFTSISFAPLVPNGVLLVAIFFALGLLINLFGSRSRGGVLRIMAFAVLIIALMGPQYVHEQRLPQRDIALVLTDRSPSQLIGKRAAQRDSTLSTLLENLTGFSESLETIVVEFGLPQNRGERIDATYLADAINRAAHDIPADRFAGAIVVTDGQVHDIEQTNDWHDRLNGPVHVLLNGEKDRFDRRVVIETAPAYAVVGEEALIVFRVEDTELSEAQNEPVTVTLNVDGNLKFRQAVVPGQRAVFPFVLQHAGETVVEIIAAAADGELSIVNNTGVATVNGVRDRLRVLLVSGQPHAGERTWRNLLKSDPAVDLVHFTILRPPSKSDFTPIEELALITFPTFELFDIRISEFDLMVFDRYVVRYVLSPRYFNNIENYVKDGGGLLVVVGPEYADGRSLNETALGSILPVEPTGEILEQGFHPRVSEAGRLHPITQPLTAFDTKASEQPNWGRWFRQLETQRYLDEETDQEKGTVLMTGAADQPLLLVSREGEGRVGIMTSDHIWLWARGFEGGGPQAELLRRTAHWLMKEPTLEEERLIARIEGQALVIDRVSQTRLPETVTVTGPTGVDQIVNLNEVEPGRAGGRMTAGLPGVYRVNDKGLRTLVSAGAINPREYNDLTATDRVLGPVASATGGGVWWLNEGTPEIRRTKPGRNQSGNNWLGLQGNDAYVVTGLETDDLLPAWATVLIVNLLLLGAWWREGR